MFAVVLFVYISSFKPGYITLVLSHGALNILTVGEKRIARAAHACCVSSFWIKPRIPCGFEGPTLTSLGERLFLCSELSFLKIQKYMYSLFLVWLSSIFIGWKLILVFQWPLMPPCVTEAWCSLAAQAGKTVQFFFSNLCGRVVQL